MYEALKESVDKLRGLLAVCNKGRLTEPVVESIMNTIDKNVEALAKAEGK